MPKPLDSDRHGGTFETSPNPRNGEVSIVRAELLKPVNQAIAETGTAPAIKYITPSVAANCASSPGRGGARNRADRVSHALKAKQIANLIAAERHADAIGLPFTRMTTIHWEAAGVPLRDMARATGRFIDRLTKALIRHGSGTAWLWVHENVPGSGHDKGGHCHLLYHIPAEHVDRVVRLQKRWLRAITRRPYRKGVIHSRPVGFLLGIEIGNPALHFENAQVALGYVCKGAPQAVLDAAGIDRQHEPQGLIIGRRCSTSENTGPSAREA
jgi:hypothetical protein